MIIVQKIDDLENWIEENRPDKESNKPYFIPIVMADGFVLPKDQLILKGLEVLNIVWYSEENWQIKKRNEVVEHLVEAATVFGLGEFIEKFFFLNREIIQNWIINGGEGLLILFKTSEDVELDYTNNEGVSPRQYAIKLLDSEPIELIGAFYRRTDQFDENGNYYLEYADQVTLSNGILMTKDNYTQYDGSEGWHWYEDGEIVSIATPSTWEKIKNFFKIG